MQEEIASLEAKLTELRRERESLREGIAAEEVTIAAVKEELSVEQLQLDKEREQIERRDSDLKKEEVGKRGEGGEKAKTSHHSVGVCYVLPWHK